MDWCLACEQALLWSLMHPSLPTVPIRLAGVYLRFFQPSLPRSQPFNTKSQQVSQPAHANNQNKILTEKISMSWDLSKVGQLPTGLAHLHRNRTSVSTCTYCIYFQMFKYTSQWHSTVFRLDSSKLRQIPLFMVSPHPPTCQTPTTSITFSRSGKNLDQYCKCPSKPSVSSDKQFTE